MRDSGFPKSRAPGVHPNAFSAAPSLGFLPFSAFPLRTAASNGRDCRTRPPASSGVLNLLTPSSALSLPTLFHAGSAHGTTLQSFVPLAQPYTVSSAVPLLTFQRLQGFDQRESPPLDPVV